MPVLINNIRLSIDEDISVLKKKAARLSNISEKYIEDFKILKESVDARRKGKIDFVYTIQYECRDDNKVVLRANNPNIKFKDVEIQREINRGLIKLKERPVIIGFGPAGTFAGLVLAKNGYSPLILERGGNVFDREKSINNFISSRKLDENSNIQFGEGGAGTFSDGKLTTRIKDERCDYILKEFVENGAPPEIIYSGKPHIGTDILKVVVKNLREKIISLNGEVRFNSCVTGIKCSGDRITSLVVNGEYEIPVSVVILAIGHSSRDTYEMLLNNGVAMDKKPFAIGLRVEHLQDMLDERQYGKFKDHPKLKAADYRFTYNSKRYNRPCYTFCMCPGGYVVPASSEKERLVVNGMSEYKRDGKNGNSAVVVGINPDDFSGGPLSGVEFQRHYESLAYNLGGGDYTAPVQLLGDFLNDKLSTKLGSVEPTYPMGYALRELKNCIPPYVNEALKEGFVHFDSLLKGFSDYDSILTGIETRTSAPVRIERDENFSSISLRGLYPCGEGAGYAGGIVSAAVDGVKTAEKIIESFSPII